LGADFHDARHARWAQGPVVPLDQSHVLCRSWLLPLSAKKKEVTKCH
jgi:hypothetical protein